MSELLIFAGTLEGRTIAEYASGHGISTYVCVATEYGGSLLSNNEYMTVSDHRLSAEEMVQLMISENPRVVIDSTHPYAVEVTKNIREACRLAGKPYLRLLRGSEPGAGLMPGFVRYVDSVEQAVEFLNTTEGNVLVTTGSKELARFTAVEGFRERIYARVLSLPGVVADCAALGFTGAHLICMQGPFSVEMNVAMLRQCKAKWLVTKESGTTGGFPEKCEAAQTAGAGLVVIGRPLKEEGLSLIRCRGYLAKLFKIPAKQKVSLVGIGMGGEGTLTEAARNCLNQAELVIGARRMADSVAEKGQAVYYAYDPAEIRDYLAEHPEYERVAIALSGDVGFYSGAKRLIEALPDEPEIICGISSPVYFCSRLGVAWENVRMVSVHGRDQNLVGEIVRHEKVFALIGSRTGAGEICRKLTDYGLGEVRIWLGENLSYPEERITSGTAAELADRETEALCVLYAENSRWKRNVTLGIPDEAFERAKVPMTKEEVRTVSVSKLCLAEDSVCYDIGAGTGSISIEMALSAYRGRVYAVERNEEAVELINRNKKKFAADNLTVIRGLAPEAMKELPPPTHAFIGGSSGNLREILGALFDKNPRLRVVINAISLETLTESLECLKEFSVTNTEIVQMSVSRSKEIGRYHMMMGQNPIYVISFDGAGDVALCPCSEQAEITG